VLINNHEERLGESCSQLQKMSSHVHCQINSSGNLIDWCDVHDVQMPMTMKFRINASMKVTCFATVTETRRVAGVQCERLLLGYGEEVKAIDPINFKVNWMVVEELPLVEVVVASNVWAMQRIGCSGSNINTVGA